MIKCKTAKNHMKSISLTLIIISVLITLASCASSKSTDTGSKSSPSVGAASDMTKSKDTSTPSSTSSTSSNSTLPSTYKLSQTGHKIIQTGRMNLETTTFDETLLKIQNYVNSIGGYIQSSSIQGKGIDVNNTTSKRQGSLIFRVPENKYADFFTSIKSYGTITFQETTGEDVTDQYFDTDARLKSLITQEERILDILKKTDKLSDVMELEKHLSDLRYQIENLTGTLKKWDNLISFSTITLQIQEVEEITKVAPEKSNGLVKRMSYAFTNSVKQLGIFIQALIVFISTILPFILVAVLILFAILPIIKKYNKIRNDRSNSSGNSLSYDPKDNDDSKHND